jgi:hypothetical protein
VEGGDRSFHVTIAPNTFFRETLGYGTPSANLHGRGSIHSAMADTIEGVRTVPLQTACRLDICQVGGIAFTYPRYNSLVILWNVVKPPPHDG